jgi:hypothetical protein
VSDPQPLSSQPLCRIEGFLCNPSIKLTISIRYCSILLASDTLRADEIQSIIIDGISQSSVRSLAEWLLRVSLGRRDDDGTAASAKTGNSNNLRDVAFGRL